MRVHPVAVLLLLLPSIASCRFQDLTPGSTRRDEPAVQAAVAAFYQSLATRDSGGLGRTTFPAAMVVLPAGNTVALVPMRTLLDVPERRNQDGGVRVVRSDVHVDADIASDRVGVSVRGSNGLPQYDATDVVLLARRDGQWQVAQAAFGPWHTRSGP